MTTFGCGRYHPNKPLLYFTLKWVDGELVPINRHMRGIIWLAWKFLWQQLAEISKSQRQRGIFNARAALQGMFRMHHTAVIASLYDYRIVQQDKASGARKRCKPEIENAESFRVWPFVTINDDKSLTYTKVYSDLLDSYNITKTKGITAP